MLNKRKRITATATWDKIADPSQVVPNSYGDALLNLEATAVVDNDAIAAAVWSEDTTTYSDPDAGYKLEQASAGGVIDNEAIAQAVWDKNADPSDIVPGSFGDELVNGTTNVNATEIADAVWDESMTNHAGAGSTGERLQDTNINVMTAHDLIEHQRGGHTHQNSEYFWVDPVNGGSNRLHRRINVTGNLFR